jgi:hypothetical protein
MRICRLTLAISLVASLACRDATTEPKPVDLTGDWQGELNGNVLRMTVAQDGTQLLGTGTLGANEQFRVTGTFIDPQVSLGIDRSPYTGITVSGQQEGGTRITGVANGYMLNNVPLVLTRQ